MKIYGARKARLPLILYYDMGKLIPVSEVFNIVKRNKTKNGLDWIQRMIKRYDLDAVEDLPVA